ncbi:hypothetical protein ANN_13872 [Periplaneta americana]|uniref:DUF4817 domain-containing protein n=1 Tax=Periplaneta americana TaxID=6978 RepID=A0ABQ8SVA9_PERAM|nr:hypothetical protein ANN_13872 [Periplaneta americana]
MAGLCEGGNEPSGSLKAICNRHRLYMLLPRRPSQCEIGLGTKRVELLSYSVLSVYMLGSGAPKKELISPSTSLLQRGEKKQVGEIGMRPGVPPVFAHIWLRENPGKNLNQVTFPDQDSNPGHLVSRSLPSKETLRGHSDSSFRGEGYIQCCVGVRLCDMYSNQELAEIYFMYGKADSNAALAHRLYQERYPQRQCPDRKTFVRLHYRLCEYGKFNSPGLGRGRPRSTTPEVQEEILEALNMTPSINTRRVALQVNVPHTTVWRLLKEYQLYPYHLQRVQALSPADYPARVRFCQWFLQQYGVNPNFPALVLFTDEAQFTRDGITNFHNQNVWAYENPRATVSSHHQVRFSLNIWAGIISDRLVGPHVLVNRLTGQAYTNFLENTIPHVLEDTHSTDQSSTHSLLA